MNNTQGFQKRFLLNLCFDNGNTKTVKTILKSSLELGLKINKWLFEDKFEEIKDELDGIKQFVAGITRSEEIGKTYTLGKYYPYLFSFHQFFHSSYRGRQGIVLETLFKTVVRQINDTLVVPDKKIEKKNLMSEVFKEYNSNLDIDVVVKKSKGKILALQLRSRDDTGGSTAKASLVDALRDGMELNVKKDADLLYLVGVWEAIKSQQKNITIKKIYNSFPHYFTNSYSMNKFFKNIESGIKIRNGITLKLAYGNKKIVESVAEWIGQDTERSLKLMNDAIKTLECSDDLWLSYSIVSLELENMKLKGVNNIQYLVELLGSEEIDCSAFTSSDEFLDLANDLSLKIIPRWEKDSLPVQSMSEKAHYIRDLILMRFIYEISKA